MRKEMDRCKVYLKVGDFNVTFTYLEACCFMVSGLYYMTTCRVVICCQNNRLEDTTYNVCLVYKSFSLGKLNLCLLQRVQCAERGFPPSLFFILLCKSLHKSHKTKNEHLFYKKMYSTQRCPL